MILSIKNIKILKISLFALPLFGGIGLAFVVSAKDALNYAVAFLSFISVFLSLFFALKNKIQAIEPIEDPNEARESKISFSQKFALGLGISFSMLRIFSYAFLSFALIVLLETQVFEIYAYLIGIFAALCCVVLALCSKEFLGLRSKNINNESRAVDQ